LESWSRFRVHLKADLDTAPRRLSSFALLRSLALGGSSSGPIKVGPIFILEFEKRY